MGKKDSDFKDVISSKLVRYRYEQDRLIAPEILIDHIPGNTFHNGSRMLILEDKLFLCLGDAGKTDLAQNVDTHHGKILRINLDGSIPADNPFPEDDVWSIGHRNIQGITTAKNAIYVSEHGTVGDDEINLINKAGNYGWPNVQGVVDLDSEIAYTAENPIVLPLKM